MTEYSHANESDWPTQRLAGRLDELIHLNEVAHSAERRKELGHEVCCIVFEMDMRGAEHGIRQTSQV